MWARYDAPQADKYQDRMICLYVTNQILNYGWKIMMVLIVIAAIVISFPGVLLALTG